MTRGDETMNIGSIPTERLLQQTTPIQQHQSVAQSSSTDSPLAASLKETLGVTPGGEIDEEQFQHGLTKHILDELSPEAANSYLEAYNAARSGGQSVEDAVKSGLKATVSEGHLSQGDAEKINGITFRAAQLDDNHTALYDGRGGANDPTVAKASLQNAVAKAEGVFQQASTGALPLQARSLDAPSNAAPSAHGSSAVSGGGSGEFLWKPQSESNGKLVVLLPSGLTGKVVKAGVYTSVPPTQANLVEEGRFSGDDHNGGRAHFRFNNAGGSYPDGSYVVAQLSDGRTVSFQVGETSARNTQ